MNLDYDNTINYQALFRKTLRVSDKILSKLGKIFKETKNESFKTSLNKLQKLIRFLPRYLPTKYNHPITFIILSRNKVAQDIFQRVNHLPENLFLILSFLNSDKKIKFGDYLIEFHSSTSFCDVYQDGKIKARAINRSKIKTLLYLDLASLYIVLSYTHS